MSERLEALLKSKNCRLVCEDAVRRIWAEELGKRRSEKEADKATRAAVHQMTGAFMTAEQLKQAQSLLDEYLNGRSEALDETLSLHASTRERLDGMAELYQEIFARTGTPERILDLACGFNPLYLGSKGFCVDACDVHQGAIDLINQWSTRCGWQVSARCLDLLSKNQFDRADVALMMKLLPVLEQQKKGAGEKLLSQVPALWRVVSFPLRTLGGRNVGMENHYSEWLESHVPENLALHDRMIVGGELIYILKEV